MNAEIQRNLFEDALLKLPLKERMSFDNGAWLIWNAAIAAQVEEVCTADRCELLDESGWDYDEELGKWSIGELPWIEVEEAYDIQIVCNKLNAIEYGHRYVAKILGL